MPLLKSDHLCFLGRRAPGILCGITCAILPSNWRDHRAELVQEQLRSTPARASVFQGLIMFENSRPPRFQRLPERVRGDLLRAISFWETNTRRLGSARISKRMGIKIFVTKPNRLGILLSFQIGSGLRRFPDLSRAFLITAFPRTDFAGEIHTRECHSY